MNLMPQKNIRLVLAIGMVLYYTLLVLAATMRIVLHDVMLLADVPVQIHFWVKELVPLMVLLGSAHLLVKRVLSVSFEENNQPLQRMFWWCVMTMLLLLLLQFILPFTIDEWVRASVNLPKLKKYNVFVNHSFVYQIIEILLDFAPIVGMLLIVTSGVFRRVQ
jgi:hypothetical protein